MTPETHSSYQNRASYNAPSTPYPIGRQHQTNLFNPYGMLNNNFMTTPTDTGNFGDMLIEAQDVDASLLGLDMLPWLDAAPSGMLPPLFDTNAPQSVHDMAKSPMQQHPAPGHSR